MKVANKKDIGIEKELNLMDLSKTKIGIIYIERAIIDIHMECTKFMGINPTMTITRIKMPA